MRNRSKGRALLAAGLLSIAAAAFAQGIPTRPSKHLFDFTGGAAGALVLPTDVALGAQGRAYVVDGGNHRIVAFDLNGRYLFSFGRYGKGAGELNGPVGAGTDGAGRVLIADSGNNRIQIFSGDGTFLSSFPVTVDGKSVRPIDVAADPRGEMLFVTGNTNHRVMVFSTAGKLLHHWGGEGVADNEFRYPATIVVSREGLVFVVDVLNTRVKVFDAEGRRGYRVGEWGVLPGQLFRPKGVAVDNKGSIYVSDSYMDVIEVFDASSYRFTHVLGEGGKPQRFKSPAGIAVGADKLFVAEQLANKVSVHALR